MAEPLETDDSIPDKVIPLDPGRNSKTSIQGNDPDGSITIPANPVDLDEDQMPPAKTIHDFPPLKPGEKTE